MPNFWHCKETLLKGSLVIEGERGIFFILGLKFVRLWVILVIEKINIMEKKCKKMQIFMNLMND